jgi:iron complex outermembrane receptor protein
MSPGGFSAGSVAVGSTQAAEYQPMKVTAYTAGIKNRLAGGSVTANFEGFYYDYANYQVSQRNPITLQNQVYNAGKAEIYGAQADFVAKATSLDQVSLDIAYLHAIAISLVTPAGNFDDYSLPYSPDWTVNLSYQHKFPLSNGANMTALVESQYVTSQWAFYTHAAGGLIGENSRTNLDFTYHTPNDRWGVSLWVRNAENSIVKTGGISGAIPGPAAFALAPPRTFGIRFSYKD